ncbi:hypothetical protein ACFWIQ_03225 [Kitasatospora sp. NPDC127059]|uniref:hypothetical protein n=1 Tax=unclassified Kitasatospora TaxID=2633591 RepID=UPI00365F1056
MNAPDKHTSDQDTARDGEHERERSARTRDIVAPTPADVRAKGGHPEGNDEPNPPRPGTRTP